MPANKIANRGESIIRSFLGVWHGVTAQRAAFRVFLRRIECSAFVSRTPFFTVHLVGVRANRARAKLQLQESCQDSTIRPPSVLPVACRPVVYSYSRGKNNPRFPCLFSRGEKIRGLEYCVYTSASSRRCSGGGERDYIRRWEKGRKKIVPASCIFVSWMISAFLLYSGLREKERRREEFILQQCEDLTLLV